MKKSTKIIKKILSKFALDKNLRHDARRFLSNNFCISDNNNKIILVKDGIETNISNIEELYKINTFSYCNINITGSNNTLKINLPTNLNNFSINCSSNFVNIEIGQNCTLRDSSTIVWGGRKHVYD